MRSAIAALALVLLAGCGRSLDDPNNAAPVAVAGPDVTALVGATLSFDGSASTDDRAIESFEWDFGDGTLFDGVTSVHAWDTAGGFIVTLVVVDDSGVAASDTAVVRIADDLPVAAFDAPAGGSIGQALTFDASASTSPASIATFAWTFGDGALGNGPVVEHAWTTAGTFAVRLVITDSDGLTAELTRTIDIAPPDIAGTWDLAGDAFSCASYDAALPDVTLVVTQDGTDVTAAGANGRVYAGTVLDGELTLQGSVVIDTGSCGSPTVDVLIRGTMNGTNAFTGRATAFFDLDLGCQCSAAWDLDATKR